MRYLIHGLIAWIAWPALAQESRTVRAFEGAEGYGMHSLGGRGGRVYEVTTLEDSERRAPLIPGSLRAAVMAEEPRVVVFRVSGIIDLKYRLDVTHPRITIAGQTAPGDGICLRGNQILVITQHVVIRHLRIRPAVDRSIRGTDCISIDNKARDVIVDHCSTSWASDEGISCNKDVDRVTVQWCIMAENVGEHGFGSIICSQGGGLTYPHNLYLSNRSRNPRIGGWEESEGVHTWDFRNNVICNWGERMGYNGNYGNRPERTAEQGNFVANYFQAGPDSQSAPMFLHLELGSKMFAQGNVLNGKPAGWEAIRYENGASEAGIRVNEPFATAPVKTETAEAAFASVLAKVGATSPRRDTADQRMLAEAKAGKGALVPEMSRLPGWPELKTAPAPADRDHDGLPDTWEETHGLNADDTADGARTGADGRTPLDAYLDELAAAS